MQAEVSAPNFEATHVICLAHCTDGKWRPVKLDNRKARKLFIYLDGLCDHRLNLLMAPVRVILEPKKNWFRRLFQRCK